MALGGVPMGSMLAQLAPASWEYPATTDPYAMKWPQPLPPAPLQSPAPHCSLLHLKTPIVVMMSIIKKVLLVEKPAI